MHRKMFQSLESSEPKRLQILMYHRASEVFFYKFADEFRPWTLVVIGFASISMTYQIFCTIFCPRECGFFTMLIAIIALFIEFGMIALFTQMGSDFVENSAHMVAAFKSRSLKPLELRIVKSMNVFALPIGPYGTIDRGTLPFVMSDVMVNNAVNLLLSF